MQLTQAMSMLDKVRQFYRTRRRSPLVIAVVTALIVSLPLMAAILPEDRADALYHSYDGGGAQIHGPSIMARKQIGQHFSFWSNYYIDSITSATVDVETFASPYTEERTQYTFAGDYLQDNTTLSLSYTNSEESDYTADTYSFGVSQNMFGDLTTVSLGFTRGDDEVRRNKYANTGTPAKHRIASDVVGKVDHWRYRVDLSQILTKNFILNLGYEAVTDEGYLNNPYRYAVYYAPGNLDPVTLEYINQVNTITEKYPKTHTSKAYAVRGLYYLPWRASLKGEYRTFSDSWDVKSSMYEVAFTQPIKKHLTFDVHYRAYEQSEASFYSNFFPEEQVYMGRDKELSKFNSTTVGGSVSYEFLKKGWWVFDKGSLNLHYDKIQLNYDNFLDETPYAKKEPTPYQWLNAKPYSFSATVIQFYISVWY